MRQVKMKSPNGYIMWVTTKRVVVALMLGYTFRRGELRWV